MGNYLQANEYAADYMVSMLMARSESHCAASVTCPMATRGPGHSRGDHLGDAKSAQKEDARAIPSSLHAATEIDYGRHCRCSDGHVGNHEHDSPRTYWRA